jgi:hypothetical protein
VHYWSNGGELPHIYSKRPKAKAGGVAQVIELLPSKLKALTLNFSTHTHKDLNLNLNF